MIEFSLLPESKMRATNLTSLFTLGLLFQHSASPLQLDFARVESNENQSGAGTLANGVLTIRLEARQGELRPEGPGNPSLTVFAFGEEGKPLQAPAPLIRVKVGTPVNVLLHNLLPKKLLIRGLSARPGLDSVELAAGESRTVTFTPMHPGTYFYWGRTEGDRVGQGFGMDGQLAGGLIVEPAGAIRHERVMVITNWGDLSDSSRARTSVQVHMLVNGRSWPYTERLQYQVGDSIFWRVINATAAPHPMHLHGFYYRVDSRGDAIADTVFPAGARRLAVTELMTRGTTMTMAWSPDRPGNWLFHCHFIEHISPDQRLGDLSTRHGEFKHGASSHALEGMAGLVMGVNVFPAKGATLKPLAAASPRRLDLFINQRPYYFGASPGFSFVLQEGNRPPAADSIRIPGSPIILTRGVPVEIAVHNRSSDMASVHWHGIELQSYYDGVPGWSGAGANTEPPIAPGKTFVVKFTPDRAGTFIYHSHSDEDRQLASGLYGPLIVLEKGEKFDAQVDRILLLGSGGPKDDAPATINGTSAPAPFIFQAGKTYRLRFINITPSTTKVVRIVSDSTLQSWRAFAKDGAALPQSQATFRPAQVTLGSGETFDFEFTATHPGNLRMQVTTVRRGAAPATANVEIRVR